MPNTISNFFAPVRPYDSSAENDFRMYDRMKYTRDLSMCGDDMIKMNTGNILKVYRLDDSQPLCIDNNKVPIPQKIAPSTGFVETNFSNTLELQEEELAEEDFSNDLEDIQDSES